MNIKPFRWSHDKNARLKLERQISFEEIALAIEGGGLLDVVRHANSVRYPHQRMLVVASGAYAYLVPFVEEPEHYFLKTVIPSRKATRQYLRQGEHED
jgi:uncharacterized DUF497 family protein